MGFCSMHNDYWRKHLILKVTQGCGQNNTRNWQKKTLNPSEARALISLHKIAPKKPVLVLRYTLRQCTNFGPIPIATTRQREGLKRLKVVPSIRPILEIGNYNNNSVAWVVSSIPGEFFLVESSQPSWLNKLLLSRNLVIASAEVGGEARFEAAPRTGGSDFTTDSCTCPFPRWAFSLWDRRLSTLNGENFLGTILRKGFVTLTGRF